MRIVIFINTSWNIYNFRSGLIRALQKEGFEIHAVAPEDAYSDRLTAMGCIFHPVIMSNTGNNPFRDISLVRQIYRLYRNIKPKVTLHYTVKPNIYGSLVAQHLNIPSISTISGLGTVFLTSGKTNRIAKYMYSKALRYPVRVFFQNSFDLSLFLKNQLLKRSNYDLVAGSGIDVNRFQPTESHTLPPPFIFLMMARLIEEKGIREYAEATRILVSRGLPVKCQLLGTPAPEHKRGIPVEEITDGALEYLGEVSDVRDFIGEAHAVVLPSYREGLPKSLLEAAAMKKPLITCDVPGCNEVVKDEINGLLCIPKDASDLSEKMIEMAGYSQERLKTMGDAGRKLVVERFAEEKVVQTYINVIKEIANPPV